VDWERAIWERYGVESTYDALTSALSRLGCRGLITMHSAEGWASYTLRVPGAEEIITTAPTIEEAMGQALLQAGHHSPSPPE
jgi:hypothetical protein